MNTRRKNQKGSALLEFTLVGIPLIFVLVSTFEMARGMWIYQTLAYAIKDGARYASVHGNGCSKLGNTCGITVSGVAHHIKDNGVGLLPDQLSLTLTDSGGSIGCPTLTNCLNSTASWPTLAGGEPGSNITITARYPFRSALAMFWPGQKSVRFATVNLPATSRATIQF